MLKGNFTINSNPNEIHPHKSEILPLLNYKYVALN